MKRLLPLAFCIFLLTSISAQTFCPPGAVWHYSLTPNDVIYGERGVIEESYMGDTVINNQTCKKIIGTFNGITTTSSPYTVTIHPYLKVFAYENNKVIYVLNSTNGFDTVVNFNAAIGDKWLKNRYYGQCNSRRAVRVTDTGSVFINNIRLRRIVTTYTNTRVNSASVTTITIVDTLIEKIMGRQTFMIPIYCELDNIQSSGPERRLFMCYNDDNFLLYKKAAYADCEYHATGIRDLAANQIHLNIYPNPTTGSICIESPELASGYYNIRVSNCFGRIIRQSELNSADNRLTIQLNDVCKGIYYLQLSDKTGLMVTEKIIRE